MDTNAKLYQDMTKILVKREDIQKAVAQLGREITHDYQGRDLVMVCILKGASVFFSDLIREVDLPVTLDFMALSSYRNSTKSSGVVNLEKDLSVSIKGRDVLIVEDIVDSGNTLFYRERKDCLWLPGCPDIFLRNRILLAAEAELNGPDRESWGRAYCGLVPANKEEPLVAAGQRYRKGSGAPVRIFREPVAVGELVIASRKYPAAVRLAVVPNVPRVEQCVEQERTDPQLVPICLQCFSGSESGEEFFGENRKRRL